MRSGHIVAEVTSTTSSHAGEVLRMAWDCITSVWRRVNGPVLDTGNGDFAATLNHKEAEV
jgi:hypothetical protein